MANAILLLLSKAVLWIGLVMKTYTLVARRMDAGQNNAKLDGLKITKLR